MYPRPSLWAHLQLLGVCQNLLHVDLVRADCAAAAGALVVVHVHGSWPAAAAAAPVPGPPSRWPEGT